MEVVDSLPKFRRPPVDEVVVGVQFAAPGFLPIHYGAFFDRIKVDFPNVQVMPPVQPVREEFTEAQATNAALLSALPFPFPNLFGMPRVLFVSADDSSLIQLQSDRLFFNWRRRGEQEYPHYHFVREGFQAAYRAFEAFAADSGMAPIVPNQCEVLYVNPLQVDVTGVSASSPEKVFRNWSISIGDEWKEPLEDLAFNARYRLRDGAGQSVGRLSVAMSTMLGIDRKPQMRLELTARGVPKEPTLDGIVAFHDLGHAAIVRCFTAITTRAMHDRWERRQ